VPRATGPRQMDHNTAGHKSYDPERRRGTIPSWIRKRMEIESRIVERAESIGLEPPPRLGTKESNLMIKSVVDALVEQEKDRRENELHNSPPIPF
jgi:hypothetical protein